MFLAGIDSPMGRGQCGLRTRLSVLGYQAERCLRTSPLSGAVSCSMAGSMSSCPVSTDRDLLSLNLASFPLSCAGLKRGWQWFWEHAGRAPEPSSWPVPARLPSFSPLYTFQNFFLPLFTWYLSLNRLTFFKYKYYFGNNIHGIIDFRMLL